MGRATVIGAGTTGEGEPYIVEAGTELGTIPSASVRIGSETVVMPSDQDWQNDNYSDETISLADTVTIRFAADFVDRDSDDRTPVAGTADITCDP